MTSSIARRIRTAVQDWSTPLPRRIIRAGLSPFPETTLAEAGRCIRETETRKISGILLAAGPDPLGLAIMMVRSKSPDRALWVFETEEEENPEWVLQPAGPSVAGEAEPSAWRPRRHASRPGPDWQNFGIHPGRNNLTILHGLPGETVAVHHPVAFAHLHGDSFAGTTACLQQIAPALAPGGSLLVNDYYLFGGCREAVDDYFRGNQRCDFVFSNRDGKLLVRRKP